MVSSPKSRRQRSKPSGGFDARRFCSLPHAAAPAKRAAVYLLAATSGLRRAELGRLRWGDVDLERGVVMLRAKTTKNREAAVIPIPGRTVSMLSSLRGRAKGTAAVFKTIPTIRTFYNDLAKAKVERESSAGILDFHALRVTFATLLALAGVPLVVAQRLMRHSDPRLTANVYTRIELHDKRAAVDKLGDLLVAPLGAAPETSTTNTDVTNATSTRSRARRAVGVGVGTGDDEASCKRRVDEASNPEPSVLETDALPA